MLSNEGRRYPKRRCQSRGEDIKNDDASTSKERKRQSGKGTSSSRGGKSTLVEKTGEQNTTSNTEENNHNSTKSTDTSKTQQELMKIESPSSDFENEKSEKEAEIITKIRELLECPVCFSMPSSPPVYRCQNGHTVCKSCKPRIQNCPVCRVSLLYIGNESLPRNRCMISEKIMGFLPKQCKFYRNGCRDKFKQDQLEAHERICSMKTISCAFLPCLMEISSNDILEHLKTHNYGKKSNLTHEDFTIVDDEYLKGDLTIEDIPMQFEDKGNHFFLHSIKTRENLYVWVYILSSLSLKNNADPPSYQYSFSLKSKTGMETMKMVLKCVPMEKHPIESIGKLKEFFNSIQCCVISNKTIRQNYYKYKDKFVLRAETKILKP